MVSEFMLQQTQVPRVIPKYLAWMEAFPDMASLASAPQERVLELWSGLGYNRRALALHRSAAIIFRDWGGTVPADEEALLCLPGIGRYTARAILSFAFDIPYSFLETNIRTVLLKHVFPDRQGVGDEELLAAADALLDRSSPRAWHTAMMDYGAFLKKTEANHSRRSARHRPQSPFDGSLRKLRGKILKRLLEEKELSGEALLVDPGYSVGRHEACAAALAAEGFAVYRDGVLSLAPLPQQDRPAFPT